MIPGFNEKIESDEVLLDAKNLPNFDTQQFEGRIEKPIPRSTILGLKIFFLVISIIFVGRLGSLQILKGGAYFTLSENNSLTAAPIFSERGIIYDRAGVELAWNELNPEEKSFPIRSYFPEPGFGHLLGYVSYPSLDKSGFYWREKTLGEGGAEEEYNSVLSGRNGLKVVEVNVFDEIQSENVVHPPVPGENIILSIDSRVQKKFFELISREKSFQGGAGILMNIETGELLALTSFPEFSSQVLSSGAESEKITEYLQDKRKPFLFRPVAGVYAPGSSIKPILALGALQEGIINPEKKILSTGSISIPNPYAPGKESIFKDWKAHGWVNLREALAVSSNVYFYAIGGGYEDQPGLGISNIEKYLRLFGLGEETGLFFGVETQSIIPNPLWKELNFAGDSWRLGDTYHTAIGQYGLQVSPLQMARMTAALANNGFLVTPELLLGKENLETIPPERINISEDHFQVVREGMRQAVIYGTAASLNIPGVKVAAKTGTAQLGSAKKFVNSWSMGFFPYENPKYAFVVLLENGPAGEAIASTHIMRDLLAWLSAEAPEYIR